MRNASLRYESMWLVLTLPSFSCDSRSVDFVFCETFVVVISLEIVEKDEKNLLEVEEEVCRSLGVRRRFEGSSVN